ncbi:MAG TPA: substrate-binding domain-containing protein [Natronosporangium sp.]|nr:substrate-binding domain-containing protein [Natronosporangium sp.]
MVYGTPVQIRSHRRGRRRRRRGWSPRKVATLVAVLLVIGLGVGYQQLLARACSGMVTARIVAAPAIANSMAAVASDWVAQEPATSDGSCAQVMVESRDSAEVAAALADRSGEGERPHVWVPEASVWAQQVAVLGAAAAVLPDSGPSVARSPVVVAMPQPVAEALGWPAHHRADEDWDSLLTKIRKDWQDHRDPEWGRFRFGMADPARDTAGLLAVTAMAAADSDGVAQLGRMLDHDRYHLTTGQLLDGLREQDRNDPEAVAAHVSAFPALERHVLEYNRDNPQVPLVAVYPRTGWEADYPYLILTGDWVEPTIREVAEAFLTHLHSPAGQQRLQQAGLRDHQQRATPDLVDGYGLVAEVAPSETVSEAEPVARAVDQWTAVTRPSHVLVVVDASASMNQPLPDGRTRWEAAHEAVQELASLFNDTDQAGLWAFAADEHADYRPLVPLGQLDDPLEDLQERREHLRQAMTEMTPAEHDTDHVGLHTTLQAAFDTVVGNFDPQASNLVLVITDGAGPDSQSVEELVDYLQAVTPPEQRIRLMTVSVGDAVDQESLRRISQATGGRAYRSPDGADLTALVRRAVFSPHR